MSFLSRSPTPGPCIKTICLSTTLRNIVGVNNGRPVVAGNTNHELITVAALTFVSFAYASKARRSPD